MVPVRFPNLTSLPNIFQEMERMRRDMDRLLSPFMRQVPPAADSGAFPALNVIEDGDNIIVQGELPGVKPEDIEISLEGNALTLSGERKPDGFGDGNVSFHRRERAAGRFQKALTLPAEVNPDAVEAKCEHGVLKLVLPKAEHARPKKIPVLTGRAADASTAVVDVSS